MTRDEFLTEYKRVVARILLFSNIARTEGLLELEDMIDSKKCDQRDILEWGLRFVVDGTDCSVIKDILLPIIEQEEDKYTRLLLEIKLEAVLRLQQGDNMWIIAYFLNAHTDMNFIDDPIAKISFVEKHNKKEIKEILTGINTETTPEEKYFLTSSEKSRLNPINEILKIDNPTIQKIMRELDSEETAAKALKFADIEVINKISRNISLIASKLLINRIENINKISIQDVIDAQGKIFHVIRNLSDTGEITLPKDFLFQDRFEQVYKGHYSPPKLESAFSGIEEFKAFLLEYRPAENPYGHYPRNIYKNTPVCRYFDSKNSEKLLLKIEEKNEEEGKGSFRIPNTGIKLINYSVCPKCGTVFSYSNMFRSEWFHPDDKRYKEDTRYCCYNCETLFFPSLVIVDGIPKNEVQFLGKVQTAKAIERFYGRQGKNVLTREKENIMIKEMGDVTYKSIRNDVILKQLSSKPTLIANLLQHTPKNMMLNLIDGTNFAKGDALFGARQEQRRQEYDS
ncbi:FliG C-terminal domain-containing protein [Treponema sp. R6D11]